MTSVVIETQDVISDATVAFDGHETLKRLSAELLRRISAADSKRDALTAVGEWFPKYARPLAMYYFGRNAEGKLAETTRLHPGEEDVRSQRLARQLMSACETASRHGAVELRLQSVPPRYILAVPVIMQTSAPEALGMIFSSELPVESIVMLSQLAGSHLVLWHVLAAGRESDRDAGNSAALVELLTTMGSTADVRAACFAAVASLQTHFGCVRVAVGLRHGSGTCRLAAVSGVAQFDPRSETTIAFEAAMDEALIRDELTVWPATENESGAGLLAHKNLGSVENSRVIITTPLRDHAGRAIGALVFVDDDPDRVVPVSRFLQAAERSIGQSLSVIRQLDGGPLARGCRKLSAAWRAWKVRVVIGVVAVATAGLAIPVPHRIHCECQIEPVTRRFIAAPFEGTLEKALVKPGDRVQAGDLLARLDGREIRWKRASVAADQQQAIKKRDAAQAAHNYAEMQIAALEVERLDLELQLLDYRAENLDIKSPVAGIVVTGDLERAEGAPLVVGQSLFEIAPLDQIVVEVAVPDSEVALVRVGQPMTVRLDAYPRDSWQAELHKIHPRSEIRDERNVFVAEAVFQNPQGRLSPGMKGRARVESSYQPLGWILFHKPLEYVTKKLQW